ncbi:transglycosylase domain-containing protein [Parapedobacter sp. ISTM3]|uniref:Penicillin-binding protein 1A n=1 Tax=Parapedobacter luteus TaxID=623280 RepID=A0A1T5A595_9SPHI|nr:MULTISPECIES: transglycosylase domain-containing protein [Parapedobacter]MBK1440188.1 transglycosylase domain-containing protein [Parapedobacter sp. ISTM3]SKB29927.1 penicillin-binding protein 1A [Parapedobacter luteus]
MKKQTKKANTLTKEEISRYTRNFWKILIGAILMGFLFIFSVGMGLFGKLPTFRDLENPKSNLASEVISDDGVVLGTYFVQNRSNVRYDELSPHLIQALIATEDKRFYRHSGIDYRRTFTIIFYNLVGNRQGASTITQQLALNLFSEGRARSTGKRIIQKFQEWITAVRLERNYTKEEIITMYFNTVDFGAYNTYGIKSAARTYFNTTPDKLNVQQAALLVGMLKGPGIYSPVRYPQNAIRRRNVVIDNMRKEGFLTREEATRLKSEPLITDMRISNYGEGLAPYFRAVLKREIQREFNEMSITKADGTPWDLDRDGLKIYTTINSKMQLYAEEAQQEWMKTIQANFDRQWRNRDPFQGDKAKLLETGMRRSDRYRVLKQAGKSDEEIKKDFNTPVPMTIFTWEGNRDTTMTPMDSIRYNKLILRNAFMSMEPQTGYVRAWVGGINFEHYKYDQVKMGTRQVGSTAKPFTYAVAIDNGFSPCFQVPNVPLTIGTGQYAWTPRGESVGSPITLRGALAHSQNFATAYMINEVGARPVATLTKRMGITSEVPEYPSIALGAYEASVYDMVGAYSSFVNQGVWVEPTYILRIEDKNGMPIYEKAPRVTKVLNSESAYIMVDMLKSVVDDGSGRRLRFRYNFTNPIGGKTGTTNDNADAWFIGITPELVSGVWTGAEDRGISFYSMTEGQGAQAALPVFAIYMQKVYADTSLHYSKGDFPLPDGGLTRELDCSKYRQFFGEEEEKLDDRLGF